MQRSASTETATTSTPRRQLRGAYGFTPAMIAILFSVGAPDGCNDLSNVGIDPAHLDPSSPDALDATLDNPMIVRRDNPRFVGQFDVKQAGVTGKASNSYSADGTWKNLTGHVELLESTSVGNTVDTQFLPLLPKPGDYASPAIATWQSQSGGLVHENTYEASIAVKAAGQAIHSTNDLPVRLADDVMLVPVISITWRQKGDLSFVDHTHISKNLFDFIPYATPPHMASQLSKADVEAPNTTKKIIAPNLYETPPDDVWASCGIQFQVVASFVLDLPADQLPNCTPQIPTWKSLPEIEKLVRAKIGDPWLAGLLVDELRPVYVAYGNMGSCAGWQGFAGKVAGLGSRLAEVHFARTKITTAHELGHVLGLDHNHVSGNLMRENPSDADNRLDYPSASEVGQQCAKAREKAKSYDTTYRIFNLKTDRAFRPEPPPVIGGTVPLFNKVCCARGDDVSPSASVDCAFSGGKVVDESQCQVCCEPEMAGADASFDWADECAPEHTLEDAACGWTCCTARPGKMSVYACEELGGKAIECPLEPPK
jgi:hypothetical protein